MEMKKEMEEINKAKVVFNRTQCNVVRGWFRQAQVLQLSYSWQR